MIGAGMIGAGMIGAGASELQHHRSWHHLAIFSTPTVPVSLRSWSPLLSFAIVSTPAHVRNSESGPIFRGTIFSEQNRGAVGSFFAEEGGFRGMELPVSGIIHYVHFP